MKSSHSKVAIRCGCGSGARQVLLLGSCGWRIAFTNCPEVVEGIEAILTGWNIRRISASSKLQVHAEIERKPSGFRWRSEAMPHPHLWYTEPPATSFDVVCDLHDVFFDWFLKQHPQFLCLHAAAVRVGDALVGFPSAHRAGKTTLCMALAALGQLVYGDDALLIEPNENLGVALGIAPRLRRPLAANLGDSVLKFAAARKGPADRRWQYARLAKNEMAPHGERAPIKALLVLERKRGYRAEIQTVTRSDMLRGLILQNFADRVPPVRVVDRLLSIARRAGCYRLLFEDVCTAARLVISTFGATSQFAAA
jgi:hypothetical protein